MHQMGFKIVNSFQEMTIKQKLYFQLMSIEVNKKQQNPGKQKAMEMIERSRNG